MMVLRPDPAQLVQLVTCLANYRGVRLTQVRLVKFLYLADLYFARERSGETLTGWPWVFVHYGPYCSEAMSSIDEANTRGLIVATSYESRFGPEEREVYSCDEDTSAFEHELPIYVLSPLKGAVKRWGEDTPGLLDFVYFETEPMLQALPGQRLNFSLARKPQHDRPIKALPLPREKRERALSLVQHMRKTYEEQAKLRVPEREIPDEEYQRTLEVWDGEPLKAGLKGEATMKIPPRHGT
jgi:hypothetical protein